MPRIKVCTPVYRRELIEPRMTASVNALLADKRFAGSEWMCAQGTVISYNRNLAMTNGTPLDQFDYVLFVDSDTAFTPDQVQQLIDRNVDVVSAALDARGYPGYASAASGQSQPEGSGRVSMSEHGLHKVIWAGAGMLLCRAAIFANWPNPWRYGRVDGVEIGEDVQFCLDLRERGIQVWLDMDCRPIHIGVTREDAMDAQRQPQVTVDGLIRQLNTHVAGIMAIGKLLADSLDKQSAELARLRAQIAEAKKES